MRTPGNDFELAMGFLFSEGVISNKNDIIKVHRNDGLDDDSNLENTVLIELNESAKLDPDKIRNFYINSSCGICGSSMVEGISKIQSMDSNASNLAINESVLRQLPKKLRQKQDAFGITGGLHASALFNIKGEILSLFEDVGRHNALDKLIGNQINSLKQDFFIVMSSRASHELVAKVAISGLHTLVTISAATSLAVDLAEKTNLNLVGFVRDKRQIIYAS